MESRPAPLRSRRVCRFCLTESEPLNYIYERDHNKPFQVPLTLQIMACVAIEVYAADGMPQMICGMCRWNLDRSYKFKLQCKKADEALRDYPLSGVLPRPFPPIPNDPPEINNKRSAESRSQNDNVKKSRTDNPERERRETRERQADKQREKSSNEQARHDFYEEEQDGGSEGEQEAANIESKSDVRKLEPGEIRVHACDQCERTFPLRQSLVLHVQRAHRDRNYKCTECERMFFSKYDLGKHMSTHSDEKPYSCQICQKQFSRQTLLQRHEKVHRDEVRCYGCQHCDREFFSPEELEKHEDAVHKKDKPFQCNICNKHFQYKQGLERHEILHSDDKTFVCEYCKEAFHTSTKLARHLNTHAGHRPYLCKLCPRTFLLSHHLTRHMRTHSVEKRHVCEDCGKAFKRKESLEVHQLTHTKRTGMGLTCDVCQESCRNRADYVTHIKQHIEAGEKMGPDGLQPDSKAKIDLDSDEEEEEEDQYSDGDDDYTPPAYIAKKLPKPVPQQSESDEEEEEEEEEEQDQQQQQRSSEKEEQRKEQVVYVRGKDGNMVKKTIKTLMPIQRREVQEQKVAAKQSPTGSSNSQTPAKGGSLQIKQEEGGTKSGRVDETEAQVQKIVASVFKEHKIPLKHQNAGQDQSGKDTVAVSRSQVVSQEVRKDEKTDATTTTPHTVRVVKRFVVRKSAGGSNDGIPSVTTTPITKDSPDGPKVTKRVIVRRIIRQGDTTREVIMNPDGTAIDPAELAKLPTANVVKRVVVKRSVDQKGLQMMLQSEQRQKIDDSILETAAAATGKFELKTSSASSSGGGVPSTPKSSVASQKMTQQLIAQNDQKTKEKLEQLEKRVEQQRLKIEELQARKQEYESIDEMLPERHDESEDEQQLPLKRVFVKRKQSIYDEEQEYNDSETPIKEEVEPKEEVETKEENEEAVEETPENIQKEIQSTLKTTTTSAVSNTSSSTGTPAPAKKGPTISSNKVYTNKRYMIVRPNETSEVEEMSRELCNILETTDSVVKMQETVLTNLTQISGVMATTSASDTTSTTTKLNSDEDASIAIAGVVSVEQLGQEAMDVECCNTVETIKEDTAMEVEVATQDSDIKLDPSEVEVGGEVEQTQVIEQEENSQEAAAHLTLDTQDLSEATDIFETSDDVLEVQKGENLTNSVIELSQSNETINLNDTNDSQDSLEDKLSQMEG